MRTFILLFIFGVSCLSCKKDNTTTPGQSVEIYQFKSPQWVTGKCQVDLIGSVLQDTPLAKNQDILAYAQNTYTFSLNAAVVEKIKNFADGTPFAVTVDHAVIYCGIFKPDYSSSDCLHSITMDVDRAGQNKIVLRMGYPGLIAGTSIDDQRNNPKLIATLEKEGKLQ